MYIHRISIFQSGKNCTASCLECRQPHFADELAEWHRRIEHRTRREKSFPKTLPEFSDQQEGLLISPQEVQVYAMYIYVCTCMDGDTRKYTCTG